MNAMELKVVAPEEIPIDLLLEADPSEERVRGYLQGSLCCAAYRFGEIVGAVVLAPTSEHGFELMNIAVRPDCQCHGIGSHLLRQSIALVKERGSARLELGTGTFGYQLAFYQKAGFRVTSVERDYFLIHFPEPIFEAGIQHKDRLRLSLDLRSHG